MKKEIATSLGVIAFCGLLVQQALALPKPRFESLGPAFFPLLILGCIIGLSLLHIGLVLWRAPDETVSEARPATRRQPRLDDWLPWVSVFAFAGYVLLISYSDIPYLLLTFCFVVALAWTMTCFRWAVVLPTLGVAAGLIVLLQGVFVSGLNIQLP